VDGPGQLHDAMLTSVITLASFRQRIPGSRGAPTLSETRLLRGTVVWLLLDACRL